MSFTIITTQDQTTTAFLTILSMDPEASVKFSTFTGKWYVSCRLEICDGITLVGGAEHHDTVDDTIWATLRKFQAVSFPEAVHRHWSEGETRHERHWRWNGAAFAEVPAPRESI